MIPWKEARKELKFIKEIFRVRDLELRIKKASDTDLERFNQAAAKIQRTIYGVKIK